MRALLVLAAALSAFDAAAQDIGKGRFFTDPVVEKRCIVEVAAKVPAVPGLVITAARVGKSDEDKAFAAEALTNRILFGLPDPPVAGLAIARYTVLAGAPKPGPGDVTEQMASMRRHFIDALKGDSSWRVAHISFKAGAIEGDYRGLCLVATMPNVPMVYFGEVSR